jgi:hypothetical protein
MSEPRDDAFEKLVAQLDYPMYVVTTAAGGVNAGCLLEPMNGSSPRGPEPWVSLGDVRDLKPGHEA